MEKDIQVKDLGNNYYELVVSDTEEAIAGDIYISIAVSFTKELHMNKISVKFFCEPNSKYAVARESRLQIIFDYLTISYFTKDYSDLEKETYSVNELVEMAKVGLEN